MNQELHRLQAASLAKLDRGTLAIALEQALQQAACDCIDRPTDDRVRKVVLTISVKPKAHWDEDKKSVEVTGAEGQYKVKCALPDRESKPLDFGLQPDGTMIFNENAPEDHRQASIFPAAGGGQEEEEDTPSAPTM